MLTDDILDAARLRGDAIGDATVAAVFKDGDTAAVASLLGHLMRDDQRPEDMPAPVAAYLAQTRLRQGSGGQADDRSIDSAAAGERMFAEHGPEIMMLLCCYSLPSSYAAKKGVQVLHRTAYLARRPNRRLFETAQFVVDVMSPGGLGPAGKGLRTAQKVRLMHAAIRHLIRVDTTTPWSVEELGVPINQEDLLGTLMTFTWIILDGLAKLGVRLSPGDQQAYLDAWLVVGRLIGIEPQLLPANVDQARATTALIEKRQVAESPQGREMMAALLGMMQENVPKLFYSMPSCMIREFLPADVATFLGVPSHALEQELIVLADKAMRPLQWLVNREAQRSAAARAFSIRLLQGMLKVELDGQPARFVLPDSLSEGWQMAPADSEESFWEKITTKFAKH